MILEFKYPKQYLTIWRFTVKSIENVLAENHKKPYHPAAQDWFPTEAKQGWAGQYLDERPPVKTMFLLEEVLVRPAGGAHPSGLCGS